jgi:hypothetical protein
MLNVIVLNVIVLNVIVLNVIVLNVIVLNVIVLKVVAAFSELPLTAYFCFTQRCVVPFEKES